LINILPHIVEYDPIIDVEEFEQFTLEFSNGNERLCMGLCDILFDPIYYCIYESNITKIHGYIHIKHNDDISYIMRIIKMFHMEHN
jgi:hypothetical protein